MSNLTTNNWFNKRFLTFAVCLAALSWTSLVNAQGFGDVPLQDSNGALIYKLRGIAHTSAPEPPQMRVNLKSALDRDLETFRPALVQTLKEELARVRMGGQGLYNIAIKTGNTSEMKTNGRSWKYILTGNRLTAKMTTDSILGSYADPAFGLWFSIVVSFDVEPGATQVTNTKVEIQPGTVYGRNVTGKALEIASNLIKFLDGTNFRQRFASRFQKSRGGLRFPNLEAKVASLESFLNKHVRPRKLGVDGGPGVTYGIVYVNFDTLYAPNIQIK